jgi:hypothetical protein
MAPFHSFRATIALAIRRLLTATAATTAGPDAEPAAESPGVSRSADGHEATRMCKSVLTLSTPRRYRNKEHLRFVAQQPCRCAAVNLRTLITCNFCSPGRSAAKPVMNSQSRSVEHITVQRIVPGTRRDGGRVLEWIRSTNAQYAVYSKACLAALADCMASCSKETAPTSGTPN